MKLFIAFGFLLTASTAVTSHPLSILNSNLLNLQFAAKINATGIANVVEADRARAARLFLNVGISILDKRESSSSSVEVGNTAVTYLAQVEIGEPATKYTLLVDAGSSNTWIGANERYKPTRTSRDTGHSVAMNYGGGSFSGKEYIEQVSLGQNLVIKSQSIGIASNSTGFRGGGVDGVLGIGPTDLTEGSLSDSGETIPTVTDNLFSEGTIPTNALGIFFAPYYAEEDDIPGVLTFGGADSSLYKDEIHYVPITQTKPSSFYWGVDQNITYGDSQILGQSAGIMDTGTTMILLATDAFSAYQQAIGTIVDQKTRLLKLTNAQFGNLKPLNFNIGGKTFSLSPNAQIWPRSLNTHWGGDHDGVYLVVGDLGTSSGKGFDFINGYAFLQRYYTVYDTTNSRVGFASTKYTDSQSN